MEGITLGITWKDQKRASSIREQTNVEGILTIIKIMDMSRTRHAPNV